MDGFKFYLVMSVICATTIGFAQNKVLSNSATFHVSTSGSDSNSGTANSPLRNIQTALSRASNGDTIKVAGGTYSEGLIPESKVILLGGYTPTFSESERDRFANKAIVQAISVNIITDNKGCTIDGFIFDGKFDGQNVAEIGIDVNAISVVTHNIVINICDTFDNYTRY